VAQARTMAREARQMRQERPEHQKAPEIDPERQNPSQRLEKAPELIEQQAETLARAQTEDERQAQLKAERAAAVRAERDAWKARRREDMARRAQASAALRGSFKEAAAAPQDRVAAVLSEMEKAWPQDREGRDALWNRAEAIAVRDHQDKLNEIREADDLKRGDYRRADAARSALLGEQGSYTNEQVAARAAALKESEANRLASRQTAADEAQAIHGRVAEKHPSGSSRAQYDAIAATVRHPRLEAALRADLEARSGVRLADLSPADRKALSQPIQAEMKRRQEWEKALAVSRARVNREGQPEIEAALQQRREDRRAAWLASREPFKPHYRLSPDHVSGQAPQKPPEVYRVDKLDAAATKVAGAVGRLADSLLDIFSAPPQPGATPPPPPAPDPDIAASAKLNDEEQARFAATAAADAEKERAIAEIQQKMAKAKGLRLKP
jgi:hypothetical protein